ncbi:MAG: GGDEF domain-containing protein [Acidobacteriota bacterium]|nr:GGDEF domain-containing protein [Acidobacteriota bacterium]
MPTSLDRPAGIPTSKSDRREWWLWFSAMVTTLLAGAVLILSAFHSLFTHATHIYSVSPAQARLAAFELLLLFDAWMVYRQWWFRREERELRAMQSSGDALMNPAGAAPQDSFRLDSATGLCTRASFEYLLGKEVARTRRRKTPLSIGAIQLDDFAQFPRRYGAAAADAVIKEFSNRLRKASRGADFAMRVESDSFLIALPECSLNDAKHVLDRLGELDMEISGKDVSLTISVGWIDYKPGEVPSDLIRRANEVLHLYGKASLDGASQSR